VMNASKPSFWLAAVVLAAVCAVLLLGIDF
jgi:hypothetical protein